MFSSWDLVRPTFWYPMSSLEQSMMELEHMGDLMMRSRFPFDLRSEMLAAPSNVDDDDFFRDLPVLAREQRPQTKQRQVHDDDNDAEMEPATNESVEAEAVPDNDRNKTTTKSSKTGAGKTTFHDKAKSVKKSNSGSPKVTADGSHTQSQHRRAFSSYSFSDSSIVDDKGRRVTSTRRRYEDSTGRLKAVHERQVEDKKLRTTWNRLSADDEGQHESVCSSGTPEEFEALWQQTPFGEAQKKTIKQKEEEQQPKQNEKKKLTEQQSTEDTSMEE